MKTPLEMSRSRLVNSFLFQLNEKTGSNHTTAALPDGSITTVALDADILEKALKKLFEAEVFKAHGSDAGEREISETYGDCVKIKTGKLTDFGDGFMSALISNLVEQAFAQRGAE